LQDFQVSYKSSSISYYLIGKGPKPVFCFHGYGEDGRSFQCLAEQAGSEYTFIALDLPFHGKTLWNEGLNFSIEDLFNILGQIRSQSNFASQKFSIMGYSLGGRVGLRLFQSIPGQIEKLILLASDGLKLNFWYWFSTQTLFGNKLFLFTMNHPGWFFGFLKLINKLGWVNSSIFKFVNYYIGEPEVRKLLYQRWTALRNLKPRLPVIKQAITRFKTPVRLIYGMHDRIILPGRGYKFRKGIEEYCSLLMIPAGHQVLHAKHADEILTALLH
jgi:pimeloyl-ACP methyl ester carboxylesterase